MNDIKNTLRQFILAQYLPGESAANLTDTTPLRTSGILDSMSVLGLVTFIEQTFGIEVQAHETGVEHFDRIDDIATLIARKQGVEAS